MKRTHKSLVPSKGRISKLSKHTRGILLCSLFIIGLFLTSHSLISTGPALPVHAASSASFTFTAAGDHGWNSNTDSSLSKLKEVNPAFHISLGDLGYTSDAPGWCSYFKSQYANVEFVTGNHDTDEDGPGTLDSPNGYIASCPFTLEGQGVTLHGQYGREYYFDFPASDPIARFIMVSSGVCSSEVCFSYSSGSEHYNFVSDAIDSARSANIPWVIVGSHKGCIYAGDKGSCDWDSDLWNLMFSKKVDLVIQAHAHIYERSKQLSCATPGTFDSSCVVNDGLSFLKGSGPIIVIDGTFGEGNRSVDPNDVEAPYFAALMDSDYGFTKYALSQDRMDSQFVSSTGSFIDNFSIAGTSSNSTPPSGLQSLFPTQLTDLWLILMGIVLGASVGGAVFALKSRHRNKAKEGIRNYNGANRVTEFSSRKTSFQEKRPRVSRASPRGKFTLLLYMFLLIGGAVAASGLVGRSNAVPSGRYFDHIVIIAMENQNWGDVIGNSAAPFINSLANLGSTVPNYHSYGATAPVSGCSAGCYTSFLSGSDQGISNGYGCCISATTLVDQLHGAGLTWQAYCENGCPRGSDHFAFDGFASTSGSPNVFDGGGVSPSDFITAANSASPPNFLWYTPTDGNNMHDNSVDTGDAYVRDFLVGSGTISNPASGSLFASNLFRNAATLRTMFYLWWDEYDPSPNVEYGPMIKVGYQSSSNNYDEYSSLHTIEDNWGLSTLGNAGAAPIMTDLFTSSPPPPPGQLTASFSHNPSSPLIGQTVTFTGSAAGGSPAYSFSWNFGDATTGTGQAATHSYSSANAYQVTLTVHDSAGGTDTDTQSITIFNQPPPPLPLTAEIAYSPPNPFPGQTVTFTGTATGGEAPYSFSWDFGDSSSTTGNTAQHAYSANGTFTIVLTVADSATHESIANANIDVASESQDIVTHFAFAGPNSADVSSAITWQVLDNGNVISTGSQATLNPLKSYELRISYQGRLLSSEYFTPQSTVRNTIFMYSHHSAIDGFVVFNSTIDQFTIEGDSNTRLSFTAEGSTGPYLVLIKVPSAPTSVSKNGADYGFTYDPTESLVVIETSSLSTWQLDFASATSPSWCPICGSIPTSTTTNLWLVVFGSMIGLASSLAVLTHRARGRLRRARRLYAAEAT